MSTFISEPGTRLAGRYRLEDRVTETGGSTMWKAIDETLARPVAVLTFAPGFPRIYHVVTAARAASRMTDSRLAQVFDVEDAGDHAYVVLEWVSGDSLYDLLAAGPMEPGRAASLVAEAAQALSAAHAAGLAHLCLTPHSLRWTPGGGVKITGLGVEAAMYGAHADDPAAADTQGLGRLLYAALTAHWPGEDHSFLPPAPMMDGEVCSPRQVRAGVPTGIDAITTLALSGRVVRGRPPLTSPAALADALSRVSPLAPLTPPPVTRGPVPGQATLPPTPVHGSSATRAMHLRGGEPPYTESPYTPLPPRGPRDRPMIGRAAFGVVGVLAAAAIGLGAWTLSKDLGGAKKPGGVTRPPTAAAAASTLKPVSARGFDVYDTSGQDGNENNADAPKAIDGSTATSWNTLFYRGNPVFGGLKPGTGLILDMGSRVKLSSVEVMLGPTAGADVRIEVGDSNTLAKSTLSSFTTVASANDVPGGDYTFRAAGSATGRYVLIWFTRLPPKAHAGDEFEAQIFNIVVRGSS
ncbi:MAG: hypothetical protein ACM3ML_22700 [Micromonosporaceae bacterium]